MLPVATEICLLATRMCCEGQRRVRGCPLLPSLLPPCATAAVLGTTGTRSAFSPPGQVVFTRPTPPGDAPCPGDGSCFGAAAVPPAERGLGTPPPGSAGAQSIPGGFGDSQSERCLPRGWLWALPGAGRDRRGLHLCRGWGQTLLTALNRTLLHQQSSPSPGTRGQRVRGHL